MRAARSSSPWPSEGRNQNMNIFPLTLIPHEPRIGFIRVCGVDMVVAALLLVASITGIVANGFNYALDFTGGTVVEVRFEHPANVDHVREQVARAGYEGAQVQNFGSGSDLLLRLQPRDGKTTTDANNRTAQEVIEAVSTPENNP